MHATAHILSEFWIRGEYMENGLYARKRLTAEVDSEYMSSLKKQYANGIICPACGGCCANCIRCGESGVVESLTHVEKATDWYLHASFNDLANFVLTNDIDWSKSLEDVTKQIIAIKAASY